MSVKISELPDASLPLDGTEIVPLVQSGITCKADVSDLRPYKVYVALLTQSGTNAPVATVLENTLGGTVVWSYNDIGDYAATLNNAFTENKTLLFFGNANVASDAVKIGFYRLTDDVLSLTTADGSDTLANDLMQNSTSIQILVYP